MHDLLERYTTMTEKGFRIDIASAADRWDAWGKALGLRAAYREMAARLCRRYRERYGKEFLFSERCVAEEIAYHMNAFMRVKGYPGYHRHLSTLAFSKDYLIEHCKEIDISTDDVASWKQRTMFRYRQGIREVYRGTRDDPFRRTKTARGVRPR